MLITRHIHRPQIVNAFIFPFFPSSCQDWGNKTKKSQALAIACKIVSHLKWIGTMPAEHTIASLHMADVDFQSFLGWEIILNCVCVLMFDIKICFCKGSNAAALHLSMNQACNWWQKGVSPRASKHRTVRDVNLCFLFTARLRLAKRNQLYEAWTLAGSWGERRSSLLALRTCLSESSVQIFLDVYYSYIHHPPFFFPFLALS